ncbi:MAG: hypothetical protein H6719_27875 [Sandaracinaceae bacterium]|nr:hypothetical protein [Sandaracinaceae bacterium]
MTADAPTNASIDALFASARSARVLTTGPEARELLAVSAEELPELRATLRIREGGQDFHCMCIGTLSVELGSVGRLTYHHGVSVRMSAWRSDAWLEAGPALLSWLAARGVEAPLRDYEAEEARRREAEAAFEVWRAATPPCLTESIATLGGDGMMPRRPRADEVAAALDDLRAEVGDDAAVARRLLAWLARGKGPWSGYASYEEVPMTLLHGLPADAVIAAAGDPGLGEAELVAAARHFASHDLVAFGKRVLGDVPPELLDRMRPFVVRGKVEDDLRRFDHAIAVARAAREARAPRPPYRVEGGCVVVGESLDGPLSGLVAVGDALFSCDVKTLLRFEPESVRPTAIAEASEHFVVLAAASRAWFATMNAGVVHALGDDGVTPIVDGQRVVVELAAYGDRVAWVERDSAGGPTVSVADANGRLRAFGPLANAWSLALGDEQVYWLAGGWNGDGEIWRAPIDGGPAASFARVPSLGPSMATPRVVFSEGELLVALPDRVLAFDPSGRSRSLLVSKAPLRAIAADAQHLAFVVGAPGGADSPWSLAVAPRAGGPLEAVGTFARAPYYRHPLVLARGAACTVAGDRVIAAPLG